MKTQAWRGAALAGLLMTGLLAGTFVPAGAQEPATAAEAARIRNDIARLKREVARAEAEARKTDSLMRDEQAAAARSQERLARDRERREKENAMLSGRIQETRAKISAERTRGQGYANGIEEIKARDKALLGFFATLGDSLLVRIETGLPWDPEVRRDRLLSLKRDLEGGTASPDEAFSRLSAILKEETKNGDEIALLSRPLTRRNGEVVNAQILKIGNQMLLYADDEGKKFGILEPRVENGKTVYNWREELSFADRTAVKKAVAVKSGREAPQLVPLPLSLTQLVAAAQDDRKGGR
jgi:hypothetical protein